MSGVVRGLTIPAEFVTEVIGEAVVLLPLPSLNTTAY